MRNTLSAAVLTFGLLARPFMAWAEGKTYAVVIGIDEYVKSSIPALRYAVADAKLFSQALQDVVHVPKENIFLMTSDSPEETAQPKLTNVAYRLGYLREKVTKEDTVIFYFAGHGLTMDGQSYLLTEEADNRNGAALKFSALRGSDLTDLLKVYGAKKAMVMLDACRNSPGKANNTLDDKFSKDMVNAGGIEQSATLFSCSVGERSWEWDEKKHGFFTYFLVEGLRQQAADTTGNVTLQNLSNYVSNATAESTGRLASAKQNPFMHYQGTGQQNWLLAHVAPRANVAAMSPQKKDADTSKFIAELDAARARIDAEVALRKAAEERANREESKRRELEQAVAILQKQNGLAADKISPANPMVVAYADRGSVSLADADKKALEAEVARLRAENDALKSRLTSLEKTVGMNSREVTLDSDLLDKKWAEAKLARDDMDKKWAAGALAVLPADSGAGGTSGGASDSRVRLEQNLRDSLSSHMKLVEKNYGAGMQAKYTASVQARPDKKTALDEMAFLHDQLEAQRQTTLTHSAKLGAAQCALVDSRQRLTEAETLINKYEAIIKDLTAKLAESERKLVEMKARAEVADKEAREAKERVAVLEQKLVAFEDGMEKKFKGTPIAKDWTRQTRRARLEDFSGILNAGPEAQEFGPQK